ncbi:MAG: surface carbohydrate biosynthesis protein [Parvibaculaceae bacterium]
MPRTLPQTLLIPVETLNREFDAKLLLALKAAERGYSPIIGGRTLIHRHLPKLPRSIYLAKGIRTGNRLMMSILESLGHVIVALDEEALIRVNDEALHLMFDEETFNRPRQLYAWGRSNAEVWRSYKGYRGTPIIETGNPRIDLLRPELRSFFKEDVAGLRKRFGNFVLFSSNFAVVNHFIPDYVRFRVGKGASKERSAELKGGYHAHKRELFERFLTLLPRVASAIAPRQLVIRPHPSENAAVWSRIRDEHENVHVVHEGPIAPWISGAEALLHSGCTSAVEAAVLEVPAFAYRPVENARFDAYLPNSLSRNFSDDEMLIAALCDSLEKGGSGDRLTPDQRSLLREHIASVDGPLASDRILDALQAGSAELGSDHRPSFAGELSGRLRHGVRGAVRAITTRARKGKSSAVYSRHKFPGISEAEVNARIERFRAVVPGLPLVRARERLPNVFELRPD